MGSNAMDLDARQLEIRQHLSAAIFHAEAALAHVSMRDHEAEWLELVLAITHLQSGMRR